MAMHWVWKSLQILSSTLRGMVTTRGAGPKNPRHEFWKIGWCGVAWFSRGRGLVEGSAEADRQSHRYLDHSAIVAAIVVARV
jgi:hypothetical protein